MSKIKVGGVWITVAPGGMNIRGKVAYKREVLRGTPHKVPSPAKRIGLKDARKRNVVVKKRHSAVTYRKFRSKTRPVSD